MISVADDCVLLQYIVVVAFTILLDIIQLGLYFEETQDTAERAGGIALSYNFIVV